MCFISSSAHWFLIAQNRIKTKWKKKSNSKMRKTSCAQLCFASIRTTFFPESSSLSLFIYLFRFYFHHRLISLHSILKRPIRRGVALRSQSVCVCAARKEKNSRKKKFSERFCSTIRFSFVVCRFVERFFSSFFFLRFCVRSCENRTTTESNANVFNFFFFFLSISFCFSVIFYENSIRFGRIFSFSLLFINVCLCLSL